MFFQWFSPILSQFPACFARTWLHYSKSESCKFIKWFVLPHGRTPRPLELYRPLDWPLKSGL